MQRPLLWHSPGYERITNPPRFKKKEGPHLEEDVGTAGSLGLPPNSHHEAVPSHLEPRGIPACAQPGEGFGFGGRRSTASGDSKKAA